MNSLLKHASIILGLAIAVWLAWGEWPPHFGPALIVVASVAAWVFVVLYALLSHGAWARTKTGRHLMVLTLGLALLGTHSLARRIWGDCDWGVFGDAQAHRELIYLVLTYQLINRCVLLVVSHVKGERRRRAQDALLAAQLEGERPLRTFD